MFHTVSATTQLVTPYVANRLGYGIKHMVVISPNMVTDRYFIVGVLTLAFCLAIAIKPNFFKPKDALDTEDHQWKHSEKFETIQKSGLVRLIPYLHY